MLISCPECRRDVSDAASACPGCGHPLTGGLPFIPGAIPGQSGGPTMAGSFGLGIVGGVVQFLGGIALLLSLVAFVLHGPAAPFWLVVSVLMLGGGAYAKYVSRQSVRTTH